MVNTRTGTHDGENENNDARATGQQPPQAPQVNQWNFEVFMLAQIELMRMMTQQLQNQQRQQQQQPQGAPPQQSKMFEFLRTKPPTFKVVGTPLDAEDWIRYRGTQVGDSPLPFFLFLPPSTFFYL
uniref:Uncharacterized protein n=1 Tax=Oryza punctata TaxID=4537 RepID=A0A0E0MFC3_ORYPU